MQGRKNRIEGIKPIRSVAPINKCFQSESNPGTFDGQGYKTLFNSGARPLQVSDHSAARIVKDPSHRMNGRAVDPEIRESGPIRNSRLGKHYDSLENLPDSTPAHIQPRNSVQNTPLDIGGDPLISGRSIQL